MIIVTTDFIPGKEIEKVLGMARGNTVRARAVGKDIMAVLRNMVGGEVTEYTKMIAESREQALDRMAENAKQMGANAVLNVRFGTSMVMTGAAEILAYGTAVVVR
ncbi:MAG: YbjQ family protein [Acidobacteria bacterium]|nr:MAG: YbjQ family protein [Acidobacteriota bacterium]